MYMCRKRYPEEAFTSALLNDLRGMSVGQKTQMQMQTRRRAQAHRHRHEGRGSTSDGDGDGTAREVTKGYTDTKQEARCRKQEAGSCTRSQDAGSTRV